MHPTVYADSLAPTVSESLALLAKGLHPRPRFVPAESRESFTFAITDYTAFAVFPADGANAAPGARAVVPAALFRSARWR